METLAPISMMDPFHQQQGFNSDMNIESLFEEDAVADYSCDPAVWTESEQKQGSLWPDASLPSSTQQSQQNKPEAVHSSTSVNTVMSNSVLENNSNARNDGELLIAPPSESDAYVNVYMIIDPKNNTCVFPKQLISFKSTQNNVSTTMFGPKMAETPNPLPSPQHQNKQPQAMVSPMQTLSINPMMSALVSDSSSTSGDEDNSYEDRCLTKGMNPPHITPTPTLMSASPTEATQTLGKPESLPPLRALSAYNFFFRDERERILEKVEPDWSEDKKQKLLEEHWFQDRNKKRRHRKTHGKIDFTTLSKLISTRWKKLSEDRKDFYRQVAARDFARFKKESKPVELSLPPPTLPVDTFLSHAAVVG